MDRKLWGFAAVGAAAIALLLVSRSKAALPRGAKILLFGDSLAVGLKAPLAARAKASGYGFFAEGVVGSRADQWEEKINSILLREQPSLILVSLGTNDAVASGEERLSAIRRLSQILSAYGATRVWIAPPSLPPKFDDAPVRTAILASNENVIDARAMRFERASDGIHATPKGYEDWGGQIWASLVQQGFLKEGET
jgi:hypothetical protein